MFFKISKKSICLLILSLLVITLAHITQYRYSEPFFNNDETRHVMTGVFFSDFLSDLPLKAPYDYAWRYYMQYPALGLLVWPPFFYFIEGVTMLAADTSILTSKILIGVFTYICCIYLFFLVLKTRKASAALITVLIFAFSPLVFRFSSHVMLEIPTLACSLGAIFHLNCYLNYRLNRHLYFACIAFSLALLTRYDGIYLIPVFIILILSDKKGLKYFYNIVWLKGILIILFLLIPYYSIMFKEYAWALIYGATQGTGGSSFDFFSWSKIFFYPLCLPIQLSWFALIPAIAGLIMALKNPLNKPNISYLAMIIGVYITFTPMAELESRHTIYWLPAFALFAADGVNMIASKINIYGVRVGLAGIVIFGTIWVSFQTPAGYIRGFEQAAKYVVDNSKNSRFCLVSSHFNGNFIYQMRRHDPDMSLWILRASKIFYGVLSSPEGGYEEFAKEPNDVLRYIYQYDPELIILEEPYAGRKIPMVNVVHKAIKTNPERFKLEKSFSLETNIKKYSGVMLNVYRNLLRNPAPKTAVEFKMLNLRRKIKKELPISSK